MNEVYNVVRLLEKSGLRVQGADDAFIYIEDPSCVLRAFENFLEYAWMAIGVITAGLIIGWGISMIRGAKNAITENFKTLILIFGILTAMWPILNVVYGGNLVGAMCKTTKVSIANVNEILATKPKNANTNLSLYEDIDIYDSGPVNVSEPSLSEYSSLDEFMDEYDDGIGDGDVFGSYASNSYASSNTVAVNLSSGKRAVSAHVNPNSPGEIYYTHSDGSRHANIGGSLIWRANNPGALRSSQLTKRMGEIGVTANGFAIFPDEETGRRAQLALLKTPRYQNKTIAQAINIYAPASDGNNPQSYAAKVARELGVSVNTFMRDLSENQLIQVAMTIRRIEGWRPGTVK